MNLPLSDELTESSAFSASTFRCAKINIKFVRSSRFKTSLSANITVANQKFSSKFRLHRFNPSLSENPYLQKLNFKFIDLANGIDVCSNELNT